MSLGLRNFRWQWGLVGLLLGALSGAWAQSAPVRIRFSHVVTEDTPKGQMALHFQRLVAQRSGGRLVVQVFPDSSLYGDEDEMEALRLGAVEVVAPSLSKFGAAGFPEFEVFDLPFLFRDLDEVHRVTEGVVGQRLMRRLERRQMVGLGFMDNGFKHLSARRPLRRVADFAGQRLRIQDSRVLSVQMRAWGAWPVALPFGESQRALASAVVDGTENPLSNFWTQRLARWQSDLTLTRHGYLGYALVMNGRFWQRLSEADRVLLAQAADDALRKGNELTASLEQQALQALRQTPGLRLHELSADEAALLREAAEPAYKAYRRNGGQVWWEAVEQALGR